MPKLVRTIDMNLFLNNYHVGCVYVVVLVNSVFSSFRSQVTGGAKSWDWVGLYSPTSTTDHDEYDGSRWWPSLHHRIHGRRSNYYWSDGHVGSGEFVSAARDPGDPVMMISQSHSLPPFFACFICLHIDSWGYSSRACRDVYRIYTCIRALAHLPVSGARGLGHGVRPSACLT